MLTISGSPHVHSQYTTKRIMWSVNLALVPSLLVAIASFGLNAILVALVSVVTCVLCEWLIEKFIMHRPSTITDGSAVVTGLLLAFNVPATPQMIGIVAIGAVIAIGVAKMTFGGLGRNPFNPALVGRVFMLISFPVQMTTWPTLGKWFPMTMDTTTGATPLGLIKLGRDAVAEGQTLNEAIDLPSVWDMILGHIGGSMGEISVIAILIGGIFLLATRIISWHIPVSFLLSAFVLSGILWLVDPTMYIDPVSSILTGGIMLGAWFMATDMVTSPITKSGQLIFGCGCGLLTIVIRNWGLYPEGVSFAILLMNAVTPLINRYTRPKHFNK